MGNLYFFYFNFISCKVIILTLLCYRNICPFSALCFIIVSSHLLTRSNVFAQINSLKQPSSFRDHGGGREASLQLPTYQHGSGLREVIDFKPVKWSSICSVNELPDDEEVALARLCSGRPGRGSSTAARKQPEPHCRSVWGSAAFHVSVNMSFPVQISDCIPRMVDRKLLN